MYEVFIEPKDDGCIVRYSYGRRGATLQSGIKTPEPVSAEEAEKIFDSLVKQKLAKGYRGGESGSPPVSNDWEREHSGIHCQLLNPVDFECDEPGNFDFFGNNGNQISFEFRFRFCIQDSINLPP